jgi:sporulation protein YlmC with PRC-barrel domain
MFAKSVMAGVAGSLLLASAALAEPPTLQDSQLQNTWRASKVIGLNVYNDKNENVGSINELLMEKNGTIKAAVLSVGGFLGMGSRYVAVPFDKIKFSEEPVAYTGASNAGGNKPSTTTTGSAATTAKQNRWYPDHAMFNANKDELKSMPEFKYSE